MADLVSVIVPIYDVEPHLRRCLDSIARQSHRALEVILIEDGSPDRCGEICDEYAELDSRFRVIHQPNRGVSAARNAGLDRAVGDFITFVDPDDWVHDDYVAFLLDGLTATGADIAVCGYRRTLDGEDPPVPRIGATRRISARQALELYGGPLASTMTAPWGKLYRAPIYEGIRFPTGRMYEDEFTTYRVVALAATVALSDAEFYYYVVRPDSATQRTQDLRQALDRSEALRERGEFFRGIGLSEASAISFQKAFLLLRHVRRDVHRGADAVLIRQLDRDIRQLAEKLWRSALPFPFRVLVAAYAVAPVPLDVAHRAYRRNRRRVEDVVAQPPLARAPAVSALSRQLAIIVVAYGAPDMLRRSLEPVSGLAVTVVDNSSLPEIAALCAELGCRYIDAGGNVGFAAGVNIGLSQGTLPCTDVLLLNPDAVVSQEQIARLHTALVMAPDVASVGPAQVDATGARTRVTWPYPSPLGTWLEALGLWRLRRSVPAYVIGSILLLRAEAIAQVGGFDERFFLYAEEADWAYRAHRLGWRHQVVEEVVAMHVGAGTSGDESKRTAHFHASQERYLRKHYGAVGWQLARLGQVIGDGIRARLWGGDAGRAARRRAALYRRGPAVDESEHRTCAEPAVPFGVGDGRSSQT